jgi:hypothetical protein
VTPLQTRLAIALTVVWIALFAAAVVDRSLTGLAQSATPVALVPIGYIFTRGALNITKEASSGS